jgi:hypothetical protein
MPQKQVTVTFSEDELREMVREAVREGLAEALPKLRDQRPANGLVTRAQLARHLAVSLTMVSRLVRRGLPSLGCGSERRFRIAEVESWMQDQGTLMH